jgi:hypothetical protein
MVRQGDRTARSDGTLEKKMRASRNLVCRVIKIHLTNVTEFCADKLEKSGCCWVVKMGQVMKVY